jgi:hypothetical protein
MSGPLAANRPPEFSLSGPKTLYQPGFGPIEPNMKYNPTTVLRMREYGESVLSNLASDDARISGSVSVIHPDGSSSIVACAYPECVGDWLFVFSLIDGFVLFDRDQATNWRQQAEFRHTLLACEPVVQSVPLRYAQNSPQSQAA